MYNLLYILPVLGIVFVGVFGFFLIKQKISEYDYKFSSIFTLLSAITDELNILKHRGSGMSFGSGLSMPTSTSQEKIVDLTYGQDDKDVSEDEEESDDEEDVSEDEEDVSEDEKESNSEEESEDDADEDENIEENDDIKEEKKNDDVSNIKEEDIIVPSEIQDKLEDLEEKTENKEININLEPNNYQDMTVKQLREMAKNRGLKGDLTKLKRTDLIDTLEKKDATFS